jgi:hypothetical protein
MLEDARKIDCLLISNWCVIRVYLIGNGLDPLCFIICVVDCYHLRLYRWKYTIVCNLCFCIRLIIWVELYWWQCVW